MTSIREINQQINWGFWAKWAAAFVGFPLAGLAAIPLVGNIASAPAAAIGGLASGAVIGLTQWLVLRSRLPLSPLWIASTSLGMGAGLALSVGLLGTNTQGNELLIRGAITGLSIGLAQWAVLRQALPKSAFWIPAVSLAWTAGWVVTRAAGVNLSADFSVFGATGALTFQLLTGLVLGQLLKQPKAQA